MDNLLCEVFNYIGHDLHKYRVSQCTTHIPSIVGIPIRLNEKYAESGIMWDFPITIDYVYTPSICQIHNLHTLNVSNNYTIRVKSETLKHLSYFDSCIFDGSDNIESLTIGRFGDYENDKLGKLLNLKVLDIKCPISENIKPLNNILHGIKHMQCYAFPLMPNLRVLKFNGAFSNTFDLFNSIKAMERLEVLYIGDAQGYFSWCVIWRLDLLPTGIKKLSLPGKFNDESDETYTNDYYCGDPRIKQNFDIGYIGSPIDIDTIAHLVNLTSLELTCTDSGKLVIF
jgi:hypothetical protein